jgi:hypothetical protein
MLQQQLTHKGLERLQSIPEHRPVILFRNNHFYVLLRHENLWTLITDQGFEDSMYVWESLSIDGDSLFVNHRFDFGETSQEIPLDYAGEVVETPSSDYPGRQIHSEVSSEKEKKEKYHPFT